MTILVILLSIVYSEREAFRDSIFGNSKHWKRFFIRMLLPIVIFITTFDWKLSALSFSTFYLFFDPILNLKRGKTFFHTDPGSFRQVVTGEKSFYDFIPGKVAFAIEFIIFTVLLYINIFK